MSKKKILFTGGGTAGHITPNIALFPLLSDFELHYVGAAQSLEEKLIKEYPSVTFHALPVVKFNRAFDVKNLLIPFKLAKAKSSAKKLLDVIKPDLIFSKGGYVSLPITLAAKNIPIVAHESDYSLGLANKLIKKKALKICSSFPAAVSGLPCGEVTGSPIRRELYSGSRIKAENESKLYSNKPRLLIMGGSQGSKTVNKAVFSNLNALTEKFDVVHIIGKNEKNPPRASGYYTIEYCTNIADYFAWADVCISRGGSNSLFELAALAIPSLIIPLASASRGDQILNAEHFASRGFCRVLSENNLADDILVQEICKLYETREQIKKTLLQAREIDGTKKIADIVKGILS